MGRSNTQRARPSTPTSKSTYAYGYPADPSYYVVLPPAPYDPARRRRRFLGYGTLCIFAALLISVALFIFWPSQPHIQVVRLNLNNISFQTSTESGSFIPRLFMNISMGMTLKVKNRDYFGLEYDNLKVGIGYRGRKIGSVSSEGGRLAARHVAYVDATLDLDGIEVLHDVFYLLKDIETGQLPLDTLTEFDGWVLILFTKISLQRRRPEVGLQKNSGEFSGRKVRMMASHHCPLSSGRHTSTSFLSVGVLDAQHRGVPCCSLLPYILGRAYKTYAP